MATVYNVGDKCTDFYSFQPSGSLYFFKDTPAVRDMLTSWELTINQNREQDPHKLLAMVFNSLKYQLPLRYLQLSSDYITTTCALKVTPNPQHYADIVKCKTYPEMVIYNPAENFFGTAVRPSTLFGLNQGRNILIGDVQNTDNLGIISKNTSGDDMRPVLDLNYLFLSAKCPVVKQILTLCQTEDDFAHIFEKSQQLLSFVRIRFDR